MQIDTLVMIIADQNGGKSNQMRTIFEENELHSQYSGYPNQNNIKRNYQVPPDSELYIQLASWHERGESYQDVKDSIRQNRQWPNRRYKVFIPAQVTPTDNLVGAEDLLTKIVKDFAVRRAYGVWLSPDRSNRTPFHLSPKFSSFLSVHKEISALAIDSLALHPSSSPSTNSINSRLLADLLFRS